VAPVSFADVRVKQGTCCAFHQIPRLFAYCPDTVVY
jgi:hypothetical protein